MKIGITGAEGTIGSVLRKGLSNKNNISSFTLEKLEFESTQIDLSNNNERLAFTVKLSENINVLEKILLRMLILKKKDLVLSQK